MSCKKPCCWTPFGVCARAGECRCHQGDLVKRDRLMGDELARAKAVREAKGKHR